MSVHHFYEQLLTLIFAVGLTFAGVFILLRVILKLNSGKQGLNYIPDGSALILSLVRTILVSSAGLFLLLLFVQALKDATINNSSLTAQSLKNADKAFDKSNGFEDLAAISSAIAIIAISLIIGVIIASIITSIFRIIRDSILYFVYYDKNIYPLLRSRNIKDINDGLELALDKVQENKKSSIKLDRYTSNHIALSLLSIRESDNDMKLEVIDRHTRLYKSLNARKVSQKGVD
jgi:hypothetical protein